MSVSCGPGMASPLNGIEKTSLESQPLLAQLQLRTISQKTRTR